MCPAEIGPGAPLLGCRRWVGACAPAPEPSWPLCCFGLIKVPPVLRAVVGMRADLVKLAAE